MKKNFLLDLDGTLLKKPQFIFRNEDIEAIKQAQQNGKVGIATGRSITEIKFLENQHNLNLDYSISLNGMKVNDGEKIDLKLDKKIIDFLLENNISFEAQSDNERTFTCQKGRDIVKVVLGTNMIITDDFSKYDIRKIVIRTHDNTLDIDTIKKMIIDKYGDKYNIFKINTTLEIVEKNVSKGNGVRSFFNTNDYTVGIGDSDNDEEMLLTVTQGYLMDTAKESLKTKLEEKGIIIIKEVSEGIYSEILECKGVIFDLDGVIADTTLLHYEAWKEITNEFWNGFNLKYNEELKGVDRVNSFRKILNWANLKVDENKFKEYIHRKNEIYKSKLQTLSPKDILPGIEEFIKRLKKEGKKIALASASKNAPFILEKLGLANYFDYIVDVEKIKNNKPNPEIFLEACKGLKLDKKVVVGIEDSQAGIDALNKGGIYSIGVGELKNATFLIGKTEELNIGKIKKYIFK